MTKVNGQPYSEAVLDRCISGRSAFNITFSGKGAGPPRPMPVGGGMSGDQPRTSTISTSSASSWMPAPSTWSVPGTFRRARSSRMPTQMANDPLANEREEIAAFDSMLKVLLDSVQRVSTACDMLAAAPETMGECLLQQFPMGQHPGGSLITRLNSQTTKLAERIRDGESLIKSAIEGTMEMRRLNAETRETFKKRDSAWETNTHYDQKVEKLREYATRSNSVSTKMQNKLTRNHEKHYNSEQEFQKNLQETTRLTQEVLETKWAKVGQVLSNFCRFYVAIFDGANSMLNELSMLAEELVGNRPGQSDFMRDLGESEFVKQAQAVGQQAKERMSSFTSSAKGKFDNARGSFDGMYRGDSSASTSTPRANVGWNPAAGWGSSGGQHKSRSPSQSPRGGQQNPFDIDDGNPFDSGEPMNAGNNFPPHSQPLGGGYAPRGAPSPWASFQGMAAKGGSPWQSGQANPPGQSKGSPWAFAPQVPWNNGKGGIRR